MYRSFDDTAERADLYLCFADRRMDDISKLVASGRYDDISIATKECGSYMARAAGELDLLAKSSPDKSAELSREISAERTR